MRKRKKITHGFGAKLAPARELYINRPIRGTTRSKLVESADRYCSAYIIKRDGRCVTCGAVDGLTNSHLFKRGRMTLRYDPYNCNCQCATCNGRHNEDREPYESWFKRTHGEDKYTELLVRSRQIDKLTHQELRGIAVLYQQKLKNIV